MNKQTNRVVRIIAGKWRSRRVAFPALNTLRPTPDRVRETLFNWLSGKINGARCLDCFAGTGVLAFESLSRGAQSVTLIEKHIDAIASIKRNQKSLDANGLEVLHGDVLFFLRNAPDVPFDIVYLDPPYSADVLATCFQLLHANNFLSENALLYVESDKVLDTYALPETWFVLKEKKAGKINFYLLRSN